jgi:hypothetical protein
MYGSDTFVLVGIVSAVLGSIAFLPYIYDTLFGETRPLRSTWLIWAVLSAISCATNIAKGADSSLWYIGTQTGFTTVIFLMSIRKGMGSYFTWKDGQILFYAATGLVLWIVTENAVYALAISITISAIGGLATMLKTYKHPETESASCWMLSAVAAFGGAVSVGGWNPVLLAYPAYLFVLYSGILFVIFLGRSTGISRSQLPQLSN